MASLLDEESGISVVTISRKTKSAEVERSMGLSGWETLDDEPPRPVTAALPAAASVVVTVPTTSKPSSRVGRKASKSQSTDASIDGWGDFDTDHLLREERATDASLARDESDRDPTLAPDLDTSASLRREQRLEALAKPTGKPPAPTREPSKQVLRQRTLAVMELAPPEGVPPDAVHSPVKSALKKSLVTHRRPVADHLDDNTKLPAIKRGLSTVPPTPRSATGLFGPHIDDSLETRAIIFQRFLPVWSLMSSRVSDPNAMKNDGSPTRHCSSASGVVARDCKSPFECSMVLMKVCKAIGISLSTSPPPEVWSTPKRRSSSTSSTIFATSVSHADVDLDSFCEFVVRNALQPAMHHFRLDRDIGEYVHTIDAVVHALVTRNETPEASTMAPESSLVSPLLQWRLRELTELQAVLPLWKKGINFIQKQAPLVKPKAAHTGLPLEEPSAVASEEVDRLASIQNRGGQITVIETADLSSSYPKKLPAHEARAVQDANLRRKLQLRNSWQPRVVMADPAPLSLDTVADSHLLGSCIQGKAVVCPNRVDMAEYSNCISAQTDNQIADNSDPVPAHEEPPPVAHEDKSPVVVLLCGTCPDDQEATLWCSACFAVYCSSCWTRTHSSTVDMSCVDNQHELVIPSARPLRTQRDALAPPVAMVYLPTKPTANGKLHKGPSIVTHPHRPNQADDSAGEDSGNEHEKEDTQELARAMSSHAILPAIKPLRQKISTMSKASKGHRSAPALNTMANDPPASAMDSTANLLKALMLGTASSASVMGSSPSISAFSSSTDSSTRANVRVYKDPARRDRLRPSAITLDAAALFPQ